jgi:hypothetical protein
MRNVRKLSPPGDKQLSRVTILSIGFWASQILVSFIDRIITVLGSLCLDEHDDPNATREIESEKH